MKKYIIFPLILLVLAMTMPAKAQMLERNDLFYHSKLLPNANQYNPAFYPESRRVYIQLPVFNFALGLPVSYSELPITLDEEKNQSNIDIYALSQALDNGKDIHFGVNMNVFGFGINFNRFFVNFNSSLHTDIAFSFPSDVSALMREGLIDRIGVQNAATVHFNDLIHLQAYERFSLGMGFIFNDHLTAGAHINLLNGLTNVTFQDSYISLYATDDAYTHIHGDLQYRLVRSGAITFDFDSSKFEAGHSFANTGMTMDLGVVYTLDKLSISASIIDLGPGIHWTENVKYTEPKYTSLNFNGNNLNGLINGGNIDSDFARDLTDTIMEMIDSKEVDGTDYWYGVPTKVFLGVDYTFNKFLRAGILFHGEWDRGMVTAGKGFDFGNGTFRCNTSIHGTFSVGSMLELTLANGMSFDGAKGSLFNPGIGLNLMPGNAVAFFLMADYISSFYAADIKGVNFSMGVSLAIGKGPNRVKKADDQALIQLEQAETQPSNNDPTNAKGANEPIVF